MIIKNLSFLGNVFKLAPFATNVYYDNTTNKYFVAEWFTMHEIDDDYFIYEIDKKHLLDYLDMKICHYSMIHYGKQYFQYINDFENIKEINISDIDIKSLPKVNVFLEPAQVDVNDVNDIKIHIKENE